MSLCRRDERGREGAFQRVNGWRLMKEKKSGGERGSKVPVSEGLTENCKREIQ